MTSVVRRMTARTLTSAVALGLVLGVVAFTPGGVDAKPVPPGGDSHQIQCRSLQNEANDLIAEYGNESTSNARREAIISRLRNIGSDWVAIKCKARYGNIVREMPDVLSPHLNNQSIVNTAGVYQEPTSTPVTKYQTYKVATFATSK
jgi:hypothetical protein